MHSATNPEGVSISLKDERVGNLVIVTSTAEDTARVKSQLKIIVRQCWSNPPQHGARVVSTILNNPALCREWYVGCKLCITY
ncbi:unnamed protein product [Protopolystoma xenopodis]|uniref:Aspartate aminotransferase, mitochondrial n=1 Tax=Protopolystoma xenopodis TaxID=117903 RepID=A0A448WR46_9PLAT|nr:unnamed protein product [Protopolystoma xenopodis]